MTWNYLSEFIYVIFSSSVRDCCFTSSAGTFHPLFLISEDFATTEYFINHIKRVDFWNLYVCLKYQTYICVYIYIYMYIYIICYTYELHLIQIRPFPSEGRIGRNSSTSYKLSPSHQENPPCRLPPPKLHPSQGFPT